ncbi:hypothetical protein KV102_00560 [Mumia sp. zg.B53]|uniref:hypothetical protein n=1 Tax=Mumia sp. zg.B53 TaxID=2855449 RepID=UPI001C6E6154|nr:hypothetical protein [Mumia sp. zg.B53]MBW9213317.1 hypothetical protein [Mumia sp. zg.B53]
MTLRRLLAIVVAVLGGCLVTSGLTSPAHAASGRVTSTSATLYRNCFGHPFSYALSGVAPGWTLTVDLVAGSGRVVDRTTVPSTAGAAGRGAFRICAGAVRPGTFTVRSRVTWSSATGRAPLVLASTRLTLRRPRTATSVSVRPRRPRVGSVLRVGTSVRVARPYGFFPEAGVRVKAYVRHRGAWRRVGPVRTTRADGTATFRVRWRWTAPRKVRVKAVRNAYHDRSRSRAVTVRSRPAKRR